MNNLERLLTIQAQGDTSWLNGAHYVLNNFMPKWVSVEDGLPPLEGLGMSVNVIAWNGLLWTEAYYNLTTGVWKDKEGDTMKPTHWYIPQPPNE